MNNTISRFFNKDDDCNIKLDIPDNKNWFSRKFEYKWASNFVEKNDIILDCGCGIEHPFKYYLASNSKKCIAIDINEKILEINQKTNKLELKKLNALDLSKEYKNPYFDKIFAISLFDRMTYEEVKNVLIEFKKVLKPKGLIIMTISYPALGPERLGYLLNQVGGLNYVNDYDFDFERSKVLKGSSGLKCFRVLLEKQEEDKETKPELPLETKPELPLETK